MKKDNLEAYFCLVSAMIIVGSSVVFGKIIVKSFPVFLASGLRFTLATLCMIPLVMRIEGKALKVGVRDGLILTAMAFCGQFMFTVLLLWGLTMTSAIEAGLITSTTPAAMALIAAIVLRERIRIVHAAGVALAVLGVIAVNMPAMGSFSGFGESGYADRHLLGNLLICAAVLGEAVFLLLRKKLPSAMSDFTVTGALCLLGCVMFLLPALFQVRGFDAAKPGLEGWLAILYFGLVFTVVAYVLWFRGVSRVTGATAGVFTAVMPVSAVTLSCIFLGEAFTRAHALGGLCILSAIFLITAVPDRRVKKASETTLPDAAAPYEPVYEESRPNRY